MSIKVSKDDCSNVGKAIDLEWLDVNGIGGYASSTILACHTRRYHGFLVAALADPPGRFVLLSKVEDSLILGSSEHFLTVHKYPAVVFPSGHRYQHAFELGEVPSFEYRVGGVHLTKQIALVHGENTVLLRYAAEKNKGGAKLRIKPLLAFRDFHALTHENMFLRVRTFPAREGFLIAPYEGMPPFYVQTDGAFAFFPSPTWYRSFEYVEEERRGFDCREDLFSPGLFEIDLPEGGAIVLSASVAEQHEDLGEKWEMELARRKAVAKGLRGAGPLKTLSLAASQFVTAGPSGHVGIIAGFPWFGEWGRDTMIALPGLLLGAGRTAEYLAVLKSYAAHERDGIIPNMLGPTPDENAYNSADAGLWFGWAVQQYALEGGSLAGAPAEIFRALQAVFRRYRAGTGFGIRMRDNGLLEAGSPAQQVTWMDAMVDGAPVTPRCGCPVEINALWFNFVSFLAGIPEAVGAETAAEAAALVPRIREAFQAAFWLEDEQRLADVWRDGERDASMRPNQIFAVSVPCSPLDAEQARCVVDAVRKELATPYGLRTLSPADPRYAGRYEGGPPDRDRAYHNGTVWPWLLGAYGEALLKVTEDKQKAVEAVDAILAGLEPHLHEAGLGTISELFDGNPPRAPKGCISQAWSVAEVLRLARLADETRRLRAKKSRKKG